VGSVHELVLWRKAFALCIAVYDATESFPHHERFGLCGELRKTARSVVCNIAEGHQRVSRKEFLRFLDIAYGSATELETQILIAEARQYLAPSSTKNVSRGLDEVRRMISGLMTTLRRSLST
jgi:four helix bundle protein